MVGASDGASGPGERRVQPRQRHIEAVAGAAAPMDPMMVVKRKAAEISTAMALLHGGDWRVQIDHEVGLVAIVRRLTDTH